MSKVGQWVYEMQEDAAWMTLEQFVAKHGASQASVWHEVQQELEPDWEMDDGA